MTQSDLAIGAAGVTSWERCCLGLPSILIAVAPNQTLNAKALAEKQAAIVLSTKNQLKAALPSIIEQIRLNKKRYVQLSTSASAICDGLGNARVAFFMKRLIGEEKSAIYLRRAEEQHCDTLYEWQTQPDMRKFSRNKPIPTYAEHRHWFRASLASESRIIFVVLCDSFVVGSVRLDLLQGKHQNAHEVSITVDRYWQGLGIAKQALIRLREMFQSAELHAEILPENAASRRLFQSCGYTESRKGWYVSSPHGHPPKPA